ncbi:SDR family NAD(P)-dependent oxidoreductase [Microvirga antarctica]|uniref:SDR family NAD(P)-dependent oxidoreductase n=1 Tax=Microvirga antarctica TaxID=2819233 RepID=UPI001B312FA8|nr:SDR family oxidoreductase [Microvirga antarctica]
MLLPDRSAIVTGGAGLLGRGIVETFLREGASVVVVDRNVEGATALAERLGNAGLPRVAVVTGDVTDEAEVDRIVADAEAFFGPVNSVVSCAGQYANCAIVDMSVQEWDRIFALNARSTMLVGRAYARQWMERNVKGSIVNISSGAGRSARAGSAHYAASKAAVNMLTQVMAIEFGPYGIRVNAVAPSVVLDRVVIAGETEEHPYIDMMLQGTPLRRTGRPDDVANAVAFLASDQAAWMTGTLVDVSGGSHCGRTHVPLTTNSTFNPGR